MCRSFQQRNTGDPLLSSRLMKGLLLELGSKRCHKCSDGVSILLSHGQLCPLGISLAASSTERFTLKTQTLLLPHHALDPY